jgi:hypothetical protein
MAYEKNTVNTGKVTQVIPSDTISIPSPYLPVLDGTTTAVTANKLVDSSADFSNVQVGDIVYNDTINDEAIATVTAVDNATTLSLSADIFTLAARNYKVFVGDPNGDTKINSSQGCLLYVGSSSSSMSVSSSFINSIRVRTVSGNDVIFRNFPVGSTLPVQVLQVYETDTSTVALRALAIW